MKDAHYATCSFSISSTSWRLSLRLSDRISSRDQAYAPAIRLISASRRQRSPSDCTQHIALDIKLNGVNVIALGARRGKFKIDKRRYFFE